MIETISSNLFQKLQDKHMTKCIENYLYLKKKLFRFQHDSDTFISFISEYLKEFYKILAYLQILDV